MRYLVYTLLGIAFAIGLIALVQAYPNNYVVMYLAGYALEMNLSALLVLAVVGLLLLYIALQLVHWVFSAPRKMRQWQHRRKVSISDQDLGSGYLALIKGEWKNAEKRLTAHADDSEIPYVSYLAAAQAAQEQGKIQARDTYLSRAYQAAPKETVAIGLIKARLHQSAGQWNMARATLEDIQPKAEKNPQFMAMMLQSLAHDGDWKTAQTLLPQARKVAALLPEELDEVEQNITLRSLEGAIDVASAWRYVAKHQKQAPRIVRAYVERLIEQNKPELAEKALVDAIPKTWSNELITLYARITPKSPTKALKTVEKWLVTHPNNATLNYAAGRHAQAAGKADKAKQYLQSAISTGKLPAAYLSLGEVFEAEDERARAFALYKQGAEVRAQRELPKPPTERTESTARAQKPAP